MANNRPMTEDEKEIIAGTATGWKQSKPETVKKNEKQEPDD